MTPTPRKFRSALLLLLPLALAQTPEEAAAHEANAQKQLADMLTDSLAMLRHGSAASVESAAEGIAALAVETTVSQPFHPITFRNAALKAGAQGCFMSGAGPTVLAVVGGHGGSVENDTAGTFKASMVADAMMAASRANNVDGEVVIASPTETGVTAFVEFA